MLTAPLVSPDWLGSSDHPPSLSQQSTLPGYSGRPMAGSGISSWILWPIGAYLWKVPDLWIIIPFHWPGYQFYHLQNLCLPLGFPGSRSPSRHVISPNILSCRFLGLVPRLDTVVTHWVFNLCSELIFTLILIIKLSHTFRVRFPPWLSWIVQPWPPHCGFIRKSHANQQGCNS